jgi:UDP-N-acetylglucosamine--N-acetylmuramyl-(pentapeptide) pyrophosphoryl-undecaprenol N-acetylglucosamine transferase
LVLGGSLGARRVNQLIEKRIGNIQNQDVGNQCGKLYFEDYKKYNSNTVQFSFIERMDFVYASDDYYRGRSVISVEVIVGKPVFYSFSNVAEDHQTKNAKAIVKKGALLLKESELESQFSLVLKRY